MTTPDEGNSAPSVRTQVVLAVPALLAGVLSALILYGVDELAGLLDHGIWSVLPTNLGVDPNSGWWIFGVLSLTGLAVGLVLWLVPGHGGHDSATVELLAPTLRLQALPSVVLVTVLALAGGVSLGPENPIIAINIGVLVALVSKIWPKVPSQLVVMVTLSGTIGALFGTPVAAALVFTGLVGSYAAGGALWDRLFLPLVAAGAGAITMLMLAHPTFVIVMPAYTAIAPLDLFSAAVIAALAAAFGLVAVFIFPHVHRWFRLLRHPVLYVTLGGVLLGVLGAIGGPITMFKGLSQMNQLVTDRSDYGNDQILLIVVVKTVALVIAAAAGFRGGRIFPSVFIGVAIGVLANGLLPSIPLTVAVAAGVVGMVLAVARDGWLALFIGAAVAGNIVVLPLLCIAILPAWLIVSKAPPMIAHAPEPNPETQPEPKTEPAGDTS